MGDTQRGAEGRQGRGGAPGGPQRRTHLEALVLTAVQLLLVGRLLGADEGGVLRPGGEGHPGVIQHLRQEVNAMTGEAGALWPEGSIVWSSVEEPRIRNNPDSAGNTFDPWVGKIPWRRERLPTRVS